VLFAIADELQSAFVGWLLIWRLIIDQADHDITERFGENSSERSMLRQARSNETSDPSSTRCMPATSASTGAPAKDSVVGRMPSAANVGIDGAERKPSITASAVAGYVRPAGRVRRGCFA
jgi:hypothetical protein